MTADEPISEDISVWDDENLYPDEYFVGINPTVPGAPWASPD